MIRLACPHCSTDRDCVIVEKGPHREAVCGDCGRHVKFVSKSELGEDPRSATVRGKIKPKQRARIIQRANLRCECCGRPASATGAGLHVGHVVSIDAGTKAGVALEVLNSDENLIAECEECNLGHGRDPLPLALFVAILKTRSAKAEPIAEDEPATAPITRPAMAESITDHPVMAKAMAGRIPVTFRKVPT